nr:GIY-YIG nuclease family protein [Pseudopedobacter sp.]
MKQYFVYILKCNDGTYYTGVTNDIDRRLFEHKSGFNGNSYTHFRRPVNLVFCEYFNDINQAIAFEKQVKGWGKKKKEAIISNNWEKLKELSVCKNRTHYSKKGFDSAQPDK